MQRSSFLRMITAVSALFIPPFALQGSPLNKKRRGKAFKVDNGKDRFDKSISLFEGDTFYTKVSTKDTEGDLFAFESTRVKKGGPVLHYHYEQDEWWYILEGEFLFKVGDETFTATAGDAVFGPRKIPHAFAKTNEGNAKMLIVFQPAGRMEAHFKAVSEGAYSKMTEEEKHKFRQKKGFEVVGPALTYDKASKQ